MTAEEVAEFFAPAPSSVSAVHDWLTSNGIAAGRIGQSVNKQWIQFDATVEEVEDLLFAEFFMWEHIESGDHDISTEEYHVPERLREHVDYVTPGVRLRTKRDAHKQKLHDVQKRSGHDNIARPFLTQLSGFPHPNSSTCSVYVTAECTRSELSLARECPRRQREQQ